MRYWLSVDCHICMAGEELVCFNTRSGQYHTFPTIEANLVGPLVSGWPLFHRDSRSENVSPQPQSSNEIAETLVQCRILVSDRRFGKTAVPLSLPPPSMPLLEEYEDVSVVGIRLRGALQFIRATISATGAIYILGWNRLIYRMDRRRRGRSSVGRELNTAEDLVRLRQIVSIFRWLRPLLLRTRFGRRFEKLVLLKLIRYHGIEVSWVHAVSAGHQKSSYSWIQLGDIVVDENPGAIAAYLPVVAL